MQLAALTAETAALWVFVITSVAGTIGGIIVSIIAALRGTAAKAATDQMTPRLDSQAQSIRDLRSDLTGVAQAVAPPAPSAPPDGGSPLRLSGLVGGPSDYPKP